MRLRLLVDDGGDWRDVVATIAASHTVLELATALGTHLGRATAPAALVRSDDPRRLDPSAAVATCGLRQGDRVVLADDGETAVPPIPLRQLVVVAGPDAGRSFPLRPGDHVLGRSSAADLVIDDPHLSRRHLQVTVDAEVSLTDLGSTNGTLLDGHDVRGATVVTARTLIAAGASLLRVQPPPPRPAAPRPDGGTVAFMPRDRPSTAPTVTYRSSERGGRVGVMLRRLLPARTTAPDAVLDTIALHTACPGPATLQTAARLVQPPLWARRPSNHDFLAVRVGWAGNSESGAGMPLPVVAQLGARPLTVVCPDAERRTAVLRWLTMQLAALCSPRDLSILLPGADIHSRAWSWATWLPHHGRHPFDRSDDVTTLVVLDGEEDWSAPPTGRTVVVVGRDGRPGRQPDGDLLRVDPATGTATLSIDGEVRTVMGTDGISIGVAEDLALALAGIRDVRSDRPGAGDAPRTVLGTSTTSAASVLARWNAPPDAVVVGASNAGPVTIRRGNDVLLTSQRAQTRATALRAVVLALAASWPPDAFGVDLPRQVPDPLLAGLPHCRSSASGAASSDADAMVEPAHLLVVADLADREQPRPAASDHAPGTAVHVAVAAARPPQWWRPGGQVIDLDASGTTVIGTSGDDPGEAAGIVVHDVLGGKVVEDSRTVTPVDDGAVDAPPDLVALAEACRGAASLRRTPNPPAVEVERTFLFSDVVRSTALVDAIGDEHWLRLLQWHDDALLDRITSHGGELVDHTGDGFFVAFTEPRAAVRCATAIQAMLRDHRVDAGFAPEVRIGVHQAVALHDGRYRGRGVHVAARIASLAVAGEVLASAATIEGVVDVTVRERRTERLRGVSTPVPLVSLGID